MKNIVYYYSTKSVSGDTVYRCLYNDKSKIVSKPKLDFTKDKSFRMNDRYEAKDEDLFNFRADLIKYNEEIKKVFFKNKDKKVFKVDVFNYNTITDAIYSNVIINSNQEVINKIANIETFKEFRMIENCLSCGLMTIDKNILEKEVSCYGYDFSKYYYQMLKKIRIPVSEPKYYEIEEIDFSSLSFGIYRCKVTCTNKDFWSVFNFNKNHFYNHSTLKTLNKYKDKYGITFELLKPDENFNYNFCEYEETVELKSLFYHFFKIMNALLEKCSKNNWLVKAYVSQAWGVLSRYNKVYVHQTEASDYDFDHLDNISSEKYKYYSYKLENEYYQMIPTASPFRYKGLGRVKMFLTEFSRNYIFDMISSHDLEKNVIRVQTDGIVLNQKVDFAMLEGLKYYPKPENKTTGLIKFYNLNSYYHICEICSDEFKYGSCCKCS